MAEKKQKAGAILFRTITGRFVVQDKECIPFTQNGSLAEPATETQLRACMEAFSRVADLKELRKANIAETASQIRESFSRDQLIIHTLNSIDELEKSVNSLLGRLSEWCAVVAPETSNSLRGSPSLARLVKEGKLAKEDMGAELQESDTAAIKSLAEAVLQLERQKALLSEYLDKTLSQLAPNLREVAGMTIAARLIHIAGSMKRLAELPSTTLQMLGAEKALFRHLTKKAKPPKYGVISQHPLILQAKKRHHGRVARLLADKLTIAARVDYFQGGFIGDKLRKELEDKAQRIGRQK